MPRVNLLKGMGSGVVRHKLAGQLTLNYERNESCRSNAFGLEYGFQRSRKVGGINIPLCKLAVDP